MKKILDYPFGKAYCHEQYVYFERALNQEPDGAQVKMLMQGIAEHYDKRQFVYISNRKAPTPIDISVYKHVDNKQMAALAIVTDDPNPEECLIEEQESFDGPFAFFKTLERAISWAATFELN